MAANYAALAAKIVATVDVRQWLVDNMHTNPLIEVNWMLREALPWANPDRAFFDVATGWVESRSPVPRERLPV